MNGSLKGTVVSVVWAEMEKSWKKTKTIKYYKIKNMQIQAIETFIKGGWSEEMSCALQEQEGKDFTNYLSRKELKFSFQSLIFFVFLSQILLWDFYV